LWTCRQPVARDRLSHGAAAYAQHRRKRQFVELFASDEFTVEDHSLHFSPNFACQRLAPGPNRSRPSHHDVIPSLSTIHFVDN
jgi:hypothetical protein